MRVRIRKLNDGIEFAAVTAKGDPVSKTGPKTKKALKDAEAWYHAEVLKAFDSRNLGNIGYARIFERSYAKTSDDKRSSFMALEPVGFAWEKYGEPVMNNTGSTPTEGRARVLLCYQAPLDKVPGDEPGAYRFEKVLEF